MTVIELIKTLKKCNESAPVSIIGLLDEEVHDIAEIRDCCDGVDILVQLRLPEIINRAHR